MINNTNNVIITGGAGGIGSQLVKRLVDISISIAVIDNDNKKLELLYDQTKYW